MILIRKLLLMNIGTPCRQSGLYTLLASMGSPEEEDNRSCKLTKYKKMSSTPDLDRFDDASAEEDGVEDDDTDDVDDSEGDDDIDRTLTETENGIAVLSNAEETVKVISAGVTDEVFKRVPLAETESLADLVSATAEGSDDRTKASSSIVCERLRTDENDGDNENDDGDSSVREESDVVRNSESSVTPQKSLLGSSDEGTEDKECLRRKSSLVSDCGCGHVNSTSATTSTPPSPNVNNSNINGEDLNAIQIFPHPMLDSPCHISSEHKEKDISLPESCQNYNCDSSKDPEVNSTTGEGAVEVDDNVNMVTLLSKCQRFDDQDSLNLSDVEDSRSTFTSTSSSSTSTPTPTTTPNSVTPTTPRATSTPTPSLPPLDLSDLLRLSEDILSHSPGKTLNLLQRHLEKGGSLLQEAAATGETDNSVRELARALHLHLTQFTERLHHTRDRLEDTARCYHLLDKAYEWALEAMKVVGRVKNEGLASPEQVGAAARALTTYLEEHPPIPEDTFTAMNALATNLNNHTLLQQCKMAQVRCQETNELLRSRQAVLQKAKRQMEFDCQSFVDLGEVLGGGEEMSPLAWLACSPLNASGRRRSVSSIGSRPRDSLSRCPSLDTDDDSVFLDPPPPPPPSKIPLEGRTSLGGIKEVRESAEDLQQSSSLSNTPQKLTSTPSGTTTSSSGSSGTSGTSSCSSSDSSGPISINNKFMKRSNTWQYGLVPKEHADENSGLDDGVPLSPTSAKSIPSFSVNSHLLIRGSQLNLSFNTDELSQEEVKKSKTLLMIMRELIQTERDYVSSLEYIIENYIPELMREDIPQALRGQRNVIFGNIEKIYEFHSGYFLRALEACEMRPFTVGSIFLRYESQFYLYALYNKNKPKSDALMSEYGSAFFRAMQLELEDRMDLASYLLKPVQRMGKYALILKQLLKECSRGDENYDDLMGAQEMVQFQLRHGNDLLAMDSLRDCDVNLKEQGRLLRQGEFVVWEGSRAKKSVRHVFLFEELILFSKSRRDPERKTLDIFQYKHSMKMTDIGLTAQVGDSSTKFEIWFRKRKPSDTYLLQAHNTEFKESWTEEISKLLWRQALRNRTMRLHEMSSMGIGNKPCLDIRPSEDQISDRSISINQLNKAPRLRTGSISTIGETNGVGKRPHSIISVSSSSASSSSSSASSVHSSTVCPTYVGTLNLGFEAGDSPRALHRSVTRTSQCSAESGILADMYSGGDEDAQSHRRVERSNSTVTTLSVDSALSPVSSTSPLSPTSLTLPSLATISNIKPSEVIYEAPPPQSVPKESPAKTLLTTEV